MEDDRRNGKVGDGEARALVREWAAVPRTFEEQRRDLSRRLAGEGELRCAGVSEVRGDERLAGLVRWDDDGVPVLRCRWPNSCRVDGVCWLVEGKLAYRNAQARRRELHRRGTS